MNAGKLSQSITWYKKEYISDGMGGSEEQLKAQGHLWGMFVNNSNSFNYVADQPSDVNTYVVRVRMNHNKNPQVDNILIFDHGYLHQFMFVVKYAQVNDNHKFIDLLITQVKN